MEGHQPVKYRHAPDRAEALHLHRHPQTPQSLRQNVGLGGNDLLMIHPGSGGIQKQQHRHGGDG